MSAPASLGIQENVSLSTFTTVGIGGPARWFADIVSEEQLQAALRWATDEQLPLLVLGGGSNLLICDEGFPGLVTRIRFGGTTFRTEGDHVIARVAAGEVWDSFVAEAVKRDLGGIECLSGIPGSVGASPMQNIGAYGQEVCDTIVLVEAIERKSGRRIEFTAAECNFSYRNSRFKQEDKDRYVITATTFRLKPKGAPAIRYADLVRYFAEADASRVSLARAREAVIAIRRQKAMVTDPDEPNSRSCGSFFMNPIVPAQTVELIVERGRASGRIAPDENMPAYDCGESQVKLSAAWLMSHAGLQRGMRHGNVGLSQKHVLAIVNFGGGTALEVLELVQIVKQQVLEAFGIELMPEPVFIGL